MKFTGRVEFKWVDRPFDAGQTLCMAGHYLGFAYPHLTPDGGYRWGLYHSATCGTTSTFEEAKAALLKVLGIAVEWQAESEEVEG